MKSFECLGLRVNDRSVHILDQRHLPTSEVWLESTSPETMVEHIQTLAVRGAPMIGIAASFQLALHKENGCTKDEYLNSLEMLRASRPTAVNLMNAMDIMKSNYENAFQTAVEIFKKDQLLCEQIAKNGEGLIEDGDNILTHCNTGGLATAGIGTAIGIIRKAHDSGKRIHVYVDETRPLLQGGRLTTWELTKLGIPNTLICDNMAGTLMSEGRIQKIFVGADRITRNGDFANKIGTYSLAVLAQYHGIPFFTAAPGTTLDLKTTTGAEIEIEQRPSSEVLGISNATGNVFNPAFDVTPGNLLTGIVLDSGYYTKQEIQNGCLESLEE